ncbi:MAG: hypothetical protein JWQ81_354 [Amycolatopsis sp.]|jgi:hypothetical protein|nr:hypothetical protein [Amycolatopsis sp.]
MAMSRFAVSTHADVLVGHSPCPPLTALLRSFGPAASVADRAQNSSGDAFA